MRYQSISRVVALLGCFIAALLSWAHTAFASDPALDQVLQIFAAVDGPSDKKSTPTVAYSRLQKVKPGATEPVASQYAYLLALVELRKQPDAVAYAGELIQRNPYDVRARLLRARLLLREKKFADVFVDLETAGRSLSEQSKKETLDSETEMSCRALGLMFGYLEGPAKPLVKATFGKGVKDRLMANFSDAAKKAFNEQYNAVLEEQKELINKGEDAFRELQAKHREESEAAAERQSKLQAQKAETEQKKQALVDQLTKKWDETKATYAKLATAYLDTQSTQAQLVNQRASLSSQLLSVRPREPRKDKDGKVDSSDQLRYDREMREYDQLARQVQGQLNVIERQLLQSEATRQQLWNQGALTEANLARLQEQGAQLGVEFALKDRAFAKQQAVLNRNAPAKKAPSAPLKYLEQAFVSYDDFNYLQEKQRLLDSLRAAM